MTLCDTNIFISAFNGRTETIERLEAIGLEQVVISSITLMELYQGMRNKVELSQMKKKMAFYDVIHLDSQISKTAIDLVASFRLSHGLGIPDAIIAATAIEHRLPLFTYNRRDFEFVPGLKLYA